MPLAMRLMWFDLLLTSQNFVSGCLKFIVILGVSAGGDELNFRTAKRKACAVF